jgi:hypothetical protein
LIVALIAATANHNLAENGVDKTSKLDLIERVEGKTLLMLKYINKYENCHIWNQFKQRLTKKLVRLKEEREQLDKNTQS